jgi:hypothetical protein
MSAPVVSGIAALVMVRHPSLTSTQTANHIKHTSADVIGANYLRVDAARSLVLAPVPH